MVARCRQQHAINYHKHFSHIVHMHYPTGQMCCVAAVRSIKNSYEYTQHKAKLVSPFPLLSSLKGNLIKGHSV